MDSRSTAAQYAWLLGFRFFCTIRHSQRIFFRAVRKMGMTFAPTRPPTSQSDFPDKTVPKKIWMYWAQGWESAPPLIKLCRDSWIAHNPGWEVVQLDAHNLASFIVLDAVLRRRDIPHAAYSDIVRIRLLATYGGVWADATTFCNAPLDTWLPRVMRSGFFAFEKPKTTIASWFLAAEEHNDLVHIWKQYVDRYWRFAKKPAHYFWFHYLFEYIVSMNAKVRAVWARTPPLNSDGPYALQRCMKERGNGAQGCAEILRSSKAPLHKFDWKTEFSEELLQLLEINLQR